MRLGAGLALLLAASAGADGDPASPSAESRPPRWSFNASLGFGSAGGGFGDLLKKPVTGDGYSASVLEAKDQGNPELRVDVAWDMGH